MGFETRSSAGCVKDTPMWLFRVFLDHGNPTLSQPSRPIPAVSRTPVFLAAGSFTDVLGISTRFRSLLDFEGGPIVDNFRPTQVCISNLNFAYFFFIFLFFYICIFFFIFILFLYFAYFSAATQLKTALCDR